MESIQNWVMLAGILVAAVVIYMVARRIVQGTNAVARAATRILLGALIVVPVILFLVYGNQAAIFDKVAAPVPVRGSQSEDIAKPKKKAAAPPDKREIESAKTQDRDAGAGEAEAAKQAAEAESARHQAEVQARQAAEAEAEAEARRQVEERPRAVVEAEADRKAAEFADSKPATTARPEQPTNEGIAAITSIEPAAGGTDEPTKIEEEAASAGGERKKTARRYYRRSHSYKPPAGANGGASGPSSSVGGAGAPGNGGTTLTLDDPAGKPPPTTGAAPESADRSLDSVTELGVPGGRDDVASPTLPRESLPEEMVVMPDVSAPDIAPGAGAPATSTAADEVKEDWSVVPVFYGTDRARADKEKRIGYDWQRGRRLELGHALVTIPKEHVVPMVERPWALKIPYVDIVLYEAAEDPKKHFTMKDLKALTKEEFLNLVKQRLQKSARFKDHALVFIHGYKTKFDNAVYRTAQIAYDLKFDGAPFLYSWPSGGTLQGYTYDRESAGQAEIHLRKFLEIVRDETGAKKVSIIAHSMGNQLLLRTLQDMKRSMPEGVQISQLILAAPDVDRDSFQNIVKSLEGIAEGITLYAASNDAALSLSRRVNGGEPRAGDVPDGGPIVMEGIDTIDATATSMDSVGINHSGYAENNALLEDIGKLITAGIRPPGVRLPKLESVETAKGTYWRYPAAP